MGTRILPILLVIGLGAAAGTSPLSAQDDPLERGRQVYDQWCVACHGADGAGEGPAAAYMLPRPRDFTRGLYQIRTTAGGAIPTDEDILRIIDEGMPGTTMPGWRDQLSGDDRQALVAYVKSFYPPFESMEEPEPLEFPGAPGVNEERLAEGREFYDAVECWMCHGQAGRGDGGSAPTLEDDWGHPIRAVDLTKNWKFNGGGSVEDIYRRLLTGLDGTPMAAFSDLIDSGFMTEDEMWSLAHYVRSLAPDEEPEVRSVIRAVRMDPGDLPETVDDDRWDTTDPAWIPLVAQIIVRPRWFDPSIDGVWVEALHDDEEIVFRLSWHDRSRSPDPEWSEWQAAVIEAMEPDDGVPMEPGPRPDRFAVQFPFEIPEGTERPYFLMGDSRSPVQLWQWQSDSEAATTATARGMTDVQPISASADIVTDAQWEEGRWQLLLRRPLHTEDPANELQFETGVPIPIAFFAWDGDNGEDETRGSVSSWYFVHLEVETPVSTYVTPFVAFLLTGGLGVAVVARAQRRERQLAATDDPPGGPPRDDTPPDDTPTDDTRSTPQPGETNS